MLAAVGTSTPHRGTKPGWVWVRGSDLPLHKHILLSLLFLLLIISPLDYFSVPQTFLGWQQCLLKHKDLRACPDFGNCPFIPILWNETTGVKGTKHLDPRWILVLVLLPGKSVPSQNSGFPWKWL